MEIAGYIDFIKEQFKEVSISNNLVYDNRNKYAVKLKNMKME